MLLSGLEYFIHINGNTYYTVDVTYIDCINIPYLESSCEFATFTHFLLFFWCFFLCAVRLEIFFLFKKSSHHITASSTFPFPLRGYGSSWGKWFGYGMATSSWYRWGFQGVQPGWWVVKPFSGRNALAKCPIFFRQLWEPLKPATKLPST